MSVLQLPTPAMRRQTRTWLACTAISGLVFATLAFWSARDGNTLLFGLFAVAFANAYLAAVLCLVRLLVLRRRRR